MNPVSLLPHLVYLIFTVLVGKNFCVSNQFILPAQPFMCLFQCVVMSILMKMTLMGWMCNLDGMHMEVWFLVGVCLKLSQREVDTALRWISED